MSVGTIYGKLDCGDGLGGSYMGNKEKQNPKRFFYPDEFEKMFDNLNKNGKFTAEFMIQTGARINEARGFIKNPIFDNQRHNITLTETKVRAKLGEKRPDPRTLPIGKTYFYKLKKAIEKHRVLSTNAMNIQLRKACVKANLKNPEEFSSHNIRKTFATWMLAMGSNPFKLAKHLGHTLAVLDKDYSTNDVFDSKDKQIMRSIWKDLTTRI